MEKAKAAVQSITGHKGQDTEVEEHVKPAVTQERVKPHQHEETTTAVDREVHKHHHHTTVQPVQDQEVLPEKHHHHTAPTEERVFHHGDHDHARHKHEHEADQFKSSTRTHETSQSSSDGQAVGEHVHHHVHENVQPVINKETVAPEVVHTTKPIHEVHHAGSEHHGTSTLPTKSLDEFNSAGGDLGGRSERHESYEGAPRKYRDDLQQ